MIDLRQLSSRKAFLVALDEDDSLDVPGSLEEMSLLLGNLGITTTGISIQRRSRPDPGSFIGSGKAELVGAEARDLGAGLIVVNGSLSPGQAAALGRLTGLAVWDRPLVIMKIFEDRAQTGEAKLQIELARCRYEIPFIKGLGLQMSRPGGGVGTRGPGETEFERHRRKLERRIREINRKIEAIRERRKDQRKHRIRAGLATVALTGYTNSGKSTLLRRLSGDSDLPVADKLFSTLDPFIRRVRLPGGDPALFADTVGFIRDLPPDLVTAFRATLEEVAAADLVILVADPSSGRYEKDVEVVEEVLASIGAGTVPRIIALNKIDRLDPETVEPIRALAGRSGDRVVPISALRGDKIPELLSVVEEMLSMSRGKECASC
ncbi:MAG: GTPase HflX [Thermovirgaceae bacterium]|nr:GTPase HflX [Synergistales bacterium]MDI9392122.1 GTPase HflX [Synergistota bacterium]HRW88130.1 GTPase HflX [Thermovirgaceae bacterium]MDD4022505.1 GTPase HflX [Synergistales bacterium]MDD5514172.1 GTPase HflX [Synergistales bacterium]